MIEMIDESFSVYSLVNRLNVQNIFTEKRRVLAFWSRTIETVMIEQHLRADVYAGFQQLEFFGPVYERYRQMARCARRLWVFGEPNAEYAPVDNMNIAALGPRHKLTGEWFLVINHNDYWRALVAQELTPPGTPHKERTFKGILSHDKEIVSIICDWLANTVERSLPT